jgi:hypothetical protein
MMRTVWAVVHNGQIELLDPLTLPEGAKVLVTVMGSAEQEFWQHASKQSLAAIWSNTEDDVYADLLQG